MRVYATIQRFLARQEEVADDLEMVTLLSGVTKISQTVTSPPICQNSWHVNVLARGFLGCHVSACIGIATHTILQY